MKLMYAAGDFNIMVLATHVTNLGDNLVYFKKTAENLNKFLSIVHKYKDEDGYIDICKTTINGIERTVFEFIFYDIVKFD